jgi:hypothetical protein
VADALAVLDAAGCERPVVVACSMGGQPADATTLDEIAAYVDGLR